MVKQPDFDKISVKSSATMQSAGIESLRHLSTNFQPAAAQKKTQDNVFVFKIIHDLRHPIQAITDNLNSSDKTLAFHMQVSREMFENEACMRDHPIVTSALGLVGLTPTKRRTEKAGNARSRSRPKRIRIKRDQASCLSTNPALMKQDFSPSGLISRVDSGPASEYASLLKPNKLRFNGNISRAREAASSSQEQ